MPCAGQSEVSVFVLVDPQSPEGLALIHSTKLLIPASPSVALRRVARRTRNRLFECSRRQDLPILRATAEQHFAELTV